MSTESQKSVPSVRFSLKAYTVKQLAEVYGVSSKTFRRWLAPFQREVGPKQGYFYNINQVKRIVARLGVPGNVIID